MKKILLTLTISIITFNCASKKDASITIIDKNTYVGKISDSDRTLLNSALKKYSNQNNSDGVRAQINKDLKTYLTQKSNDTLVISYRYNDGSCWQRLDKTDDRYISKVLSGNYKRIIKFIDQYPNRTYLAFKQKGKRHNKIVKYNKYTIDDTDNVLFDLLFSDKKICGNSIILFPNNRFIFLKNDGHFQVLDYNKTKIIKILNSSGI